MSLAARLSVLAIALLTSTAPAMAATCTLSVVATLPLTVDGPRLYVPVSMNETEGSFLVDTGSESTLLTADYAGRAHVGMDRHAGQSIYSGVGGRETLPVNQAHVRHIEVGKLSFQDWEFPVVPPEAGGLGMIQRDGILGMDFMHYFDIDVDLEGHKLTFWRIEGCKDIHPVWQGDYDSLPLTHTARHNVSVPVLVDKTIFDMVFDTGMVGALLSRDAAARDGVTDTMLVQDRDAHGGGIGGHYPAVMHDFPLLLMGNSQTDRPSVEVETESHRTSYGDGLIEWRFLKARKFWISYATNTLFVQGAGK